MATRRIVTSEKTHLDQDEIPANVKSDTTPEVPGNVIYKLLAFTTAMFTLPLMSFFLSRDHIFKGNTAYAGGFAAFVANTVLVGYIIVAFIDDKKEREGVEEEKKKQR